MEAQYVAMVYHYNLCYTLEKQQINQQPSIGYFTGALSEALINKYFREFGGQITLLEDAFDAEQLGYLFPRPNLNRQLF